MHHGYLLHVCIMQDQQLGDKVRELNKLTANMGQHVSVTPSMSELLTLSACVRGTVVVLCVCLSVCLLPH